MWRLQLLQRAAVVPRVQRRVAGLLLGAVTAAAPAVTAVTAATLPSLPSLLPAEQIKAGVAAALGRPKLIRRLEVSHVWQLLGGVPVLLLPRTPDTALHGAFAHGSHGGVLCMKRNCTNSWTVIEIGSNRNGHELLLTAPTHCQVDRHDDSCPCRTSPQRIACALHSATATNSTMPLLLL